MKGTHYSAKKMLFSYFCVNRLSGSGVGNTKLLFNKVIAPFEGHLHDHTCFEFGHNIITKVSAQHLTYGYLYNSVLSLKWDRGSEREGFSAFLKIAFQAEYIECFKFYSTKSDFKHIVLIHKVRLAYNFFISRQKNSYYRNFPQYSRSFSSSSSVTWF